jgi:hypothetical protein
MSDEEDRLCDLLIGVLTSPSLGGIDFTLGSIHVEYSQFTKVLVSLTFGYIGVKIGGVPDGARAAYSSPKNAFLFRDGFVGTEINDRAVMAHESVHAFRDIQGAKIDGASLTQTEDEAAAYVTGALFHMAESDEPSSSDDPIYVKAYAIAKTIAATKGAVVSADDVTALRNLIANNAAYHAHGVSLDTPTVADGVY